MLELVGILGEADPAFSDFLERLESAQNEFVRGRPHAFKDLWSHTGAVTLSGGHGGAIERGWDKVAARLDWASSTYQDGDRSSRDISGYVGDDIAYLVRLEIIEARIAGQPERQELRVTMVFRRGPEGWHIVHRHGDSQSSSLLPR